MTYKNEKRKYLTTKDFEEHRKQRIRKKALFRAMQGVITDLRFDLSKHYFEQLNLEDIEKKGIQNLVLLTLTSKYNSKEDLHEAFRRFIRNLRYYLKKRGLDNIRYFGVIEQNKKKTFYHIHILAFMPYIKQRKLSEIWKRATRGNAYVIDIRQVKPNRKTRKTLKDKALIDKYIMTTINYVNKYITKSITEQKKGRRYWYSKLWKLEGNKLYERISKVGLWINKALNYQASWCITFESKTVGIWDYIRQYGIDKGAELYKRAKSNLKFILKYNLDFREVVLTNKYLGTGHPIWDVNF